LPLDAISVLIVDDNDLVGESMARCCDVDGISVTAVVSSSAEALAAASEYQPDVVLMDYRLGRDNGVSVARQLLDVHPSSKVVIMTGDPTERTRLEALAAGCVGCIGKTMHIARELPDLIRRAYAGEIV
jgi:two-component system response regulator DegU